MTPSSSRRAWSRMSSSSVRASATERGTLIVMSIGASLLIGNHSCKSRGTSRLIIESNSAACVNSDASRLAGRELDDVAAPKPERDAVRLDGVGDRAHAQLAVEEDDV